MGQGKSSRRVCEECGRIIESKRPGETLCRLCEERLIEEAHEHERGRRRAREHARELEEGLFRVRKPGQ
jgi:hypothetical protein